MWPKSSRAGFLMPQSLSAVPIGLASSKPGMLWQPKQPSREIVFSPRYISFSGSGSLAVYASISASETDSTLPLGCLKPPLLPT